MTEGVNEPPWSQVGVEHQPLELSPILRYPPLNAVASTHHPSLTLPTTPLRPHPPPLSNHTYLLFLTRTSS